MTDQSSLEGRRSLIVSVIIIAFVVAYIVTSYVTLDSTSRWVPLLAAIATLLLLLIELIRCVTRDTTAGGSTATADGSDDASPTAAKAVTAIAYVVAGVGAIYLLGFLPALPLYLYTSIAVLGRQTARIAAIVAVITSLVIYAVFELALGYELYRGVFFS